MTICPHDWERFRCRLGASCPKLGAQGDAQRRGAGFEGGDEISTACGEAVREGGDEGRFAGSFAAFNGDEKGHGLSVGSL